MHFPVDYIIAAIVVLFILRGFMRGFLQTVLGPFLLGVGALASYIYYKQTQNLLMAIGLGIVIPIGLGIIFGLLGHFLKRDKEKDKLSLLSRLSGAFLSGLWAAALIIFILMVFIKMPAPFPWMKQGHDAVADSRTYQLINEFSNHGLTTSVQSIPRTLEVLQDPKEMKKIESTKEYQAVIQDEKIQAIQDDEEIRKQIESKNYFALFSNPKIKAVMADKELMQKMLQLYKRIAKTEK